MRFVVVHDDAHGFPFRLDPVTDAKTAVAVTNCEFVLTRRNVHRGFTGCGKVGCTRNREPRRAIRPEYLEFDRAMVTGRVEPSVAAMTT